MPVPVLSLRQRLALAAYGLATTLLTPLVLLRLVLRSRVEPLYRHALARRLALGPRPQAAGPGTPRLWLHAVSLGETRAAIPLLNALRQQHPGLQLLLTHSTATGWEAGRAILQPGDHQTWLPWDSPGATRRFIRTWQPTLGVMMETELWPLLVRRATQGGVPIVIANARLSERSLRRGQRFAALLQPAASCLAGALAQSADDAARLARMGVSSVPVCGNLKFDLAPPAARLAQGRAWRAQHGRPVLLAAATREGEEAELLAVWRQAFAAHKLAQVESTALGDSAAQGESAWPTLLLVPRHPQRFDEVARLIEASGARLLRRSALDDSLQAAEPAEQTATAASSGPTVLLGDSLGEMPMYYAMADLALLGGSFQPLGGQNLIESLACHCPIVLGPSTFNFAQAANWALQHGLARRSTGLEAAVTLVLAALAAWNTAPTAPQQLPWPRPSSRDFDVALAEHRGAAQRQALALAPWLPQSAARRTPG
ncbi:3-deoxy-D-manno-octulosonic acid transferase [Amphibiibacter pelophylacis]|uniref:3-deoxy-D-manno-octulosonic acid transferase n=1 Tax=Amphibiibacter pelophylacis TaxID=1799477 RepID=A0ACC6NZE4_9BURK